MSAERNSEVFWCPRCQRPTGWGTVRLTTSTPWSRARGHCNSSCGFEWPRAHDWKYFVVIRRFGSKAEYERNADRTWRRTKTVGVVFMSNEYRAKRTLQERKGT